MIARGSHLIAREDVDAWLAESAVKVVTYHHTDAGSARNILERGIQVERCDPDAAWGQGFYSSTVAAPQYGPVKLEVAVRLLRPLVIENAVRAAELVDELLARHGTDMIHEVIQAEGYDGVVIHFGPSDMWVVAYRNEQVKVVVEESADDR